ncbi:butyrophilin subfamily 1 member A1-like [Dromiciops gliroides]|uniref:butyrophilin subfamily 1 member A1-like n=1 Tax=Dromiciops gliroides TaxID=33562 RepID=UPI001CC801F9|nr:butyrophilin subfamily 1 member A1-like [Dromiciops gliroides]
MSLIFISEEIKFRGQEGLQRARKYRVDVTLDANTTHPYLLLKDNDKSVVFSSEKQDLPKSDERFDTWFCVLGKERFTSGKFYWEVKVAQKIKWTLGLCDDYLQTGGNPGHSRGWVMDLVSEKGEHVPGPLQSSDPPSA